VRYIFAFASPRTQQKYRLASARDISTAPVSFADLVEKLKPAVVNISTTKIVRSGGKGQGAPFGDDFFERFFGGDDSSGNFSTKRRDSTGRGASGRASSSRGTVISLPTTT